MMATKKDLTKAINEVAKKASEGPRANKGMVKVVFIHHDSPRRYHVGWNYQNAWAAVHVGDRIRYDDGTASGSTATVARVLTN